MLSVIINTHLRRRASPFSHAEKSLRLSAPPSVFLQTFHDPKDRLPALLPLRLLIPQTKKSGTFPPDICVCAF